MKYIVSVILFIYSFFVSSQIFGQIPINKDIFRFDPIDIGNKWMYTPNLYKLVVKDTILANQKTFRQIERVYISSNPTVVEYDYERIDSATGDVYGWGSDSTEYIMDNLNHNPGDTIKASRFYSNFSTVFDSLKTIDLFGMQLETRVYSTTPSPFIYFHYYLSKDFGMTYVREEFEAVLIINELRGAVKKGIAYGDTSTITGIEDRDPVLPKDFYLSQNYPNPFNPETTIGYSIPEAVNVKLIVYNTLGEPVRVLENGFEDAGKYSVNFNAAELSSGIYFYKLEAGQFIQVKKMTLIK